MKMSVSKKKVSDNRFFFLNCILEFTSFFAAEVMDREEEEVKQRILYTFYVEDGPPPSFLFLFASWICSAGAFFVAPHNQTSLSTTVGWRPSVKNTDV